MRTSIASSQRGRWIDRRELARAQAREDRKIVMPCATCGASFLPSRVGRPTTRCPGCRREHRQAHARARGRARTSAGTGRLPTEDRTCAECGSVFETRGTRQRFCRDRCAWRSQERRRRPLPLARLVRIPTGDETEELVPPVLRPCLQCSRWLLKPRGDQFCVGTSCKYRFSVGWRVLICTRCDGTYHGNKVTQCPECRGRSHGRWASRGKRLRLAVRDRWTCWICDGKVSEANWSLDHVVPRSLGGTHDDWNLRLAHHLCNSLRGANVTVQLALAV